MAHSSDGCEDCVPQWSHWGGGVHWEVRKFWDLQQLSLLFSGHFLDWRDNVIFQSMDNRLYAIRCHNFDGAFRSSRRVFYSSRSIRVDIYEVLLSYISLIICYEMYYVFSIPTWCMMQNLYVYFMWDVFIMDFYVCFDWDPFVSMMVGCSLSPWTFWLRSLWCHDGRICRNSE